MPLNFLLVIIEEFGMSAEDFRNSTGLYLYLAALIEVCLGFVTISRTFLHYCLVMHLHLTIAVAQEDTQAEFVRTVMQVSITIQAEPV
jgi:hypothetical protein